MWADLPRCSFSIASTRSHSHYDTSAYYKEKYLITNTGSWPFAPLLPSDVTVLLLLFWWGGSSSLQPSGLHLSKMRENCSWSSWFFPETAKKINGLTETLCEHKLWCRLRSHFGHKSRHSLSLYFISFNRHCLLHLYKEAVPFKLNCVCNSSMI